jgi:chemotaxis protein MotB
MNNQDYLQKNLKPDFSDALARNRPRRRNRYDDNGPQEKQMIWLITFTDIMGLMLTFFVMMFSMSVPEQEKFSEMMAAMNSELNPYYGQDQNAGAQETLDISKVNFRAALDLRYLKLLINTMIEGDAQLVANTSLTQHGETMVMSLPKDLSFDSGQAVVMDSGTKSLFTLGGVFSRMKNKIDLVGYAAPKSLNPAEGGSYASGWELSLSRAAAVAASLDKVGYTEPMTIRGASDGGYGDLDEIADQNERLDLSRRVDIVIMNHDGRADKVFAD